MTDIQSADDRCPLPPDVIELNDGQVHVWEIETGAKEAEDERLATLLSPEEQQRAKQFRFDKDRRLYAAAHAATRSLLAFYLRVRRDEIHLTSGAYGKPLLAQPGKGRLQFNLSHSHELALLAIARQRAVGIDVEWVKDFAFQDVARRFFTAKEVADLFALPPALQRDAFYQCWTSKEAFLKAKGTGLSGKLDEVRMLSSAEGTVEITADVPGWSLLELTPPEGYQAALVIEGGPVPGQCYRWQPALAG